MKPITLFIAVNAAFLIYSHLNAETIQHPQNSDLAALDLAPASLAGKTLLFDYSEAITSINSVWIPLPEEEMKKLPQEIKFAADMISTPSLLNPEIKLKLFYRKISSQVALIDENDSDIQNSSEGYQIVFTSPESGIASTQLGSGTYTANIKFQIVSKDSVKKHNNNITHDFAPEMLEGKILKFHHPETVTWGPQGYDGGWKKSGRVYNEIAVFGKKSVLIKAWGRYFELFYRKTGVNTGSLSVIPNEAVPRLIANETDIEEFIDEHDTEYQITFTSPTSAICVKISTSYAGSLITPGILLTLEDKK